MKNKWQKVEDSVQNTEGKLNNKADDLYTNDMTNDLSEPSDQAVPQQSSLRYTPRGRRRGMHPFAAPLGLFIMLLAAIGLVSLVITGLKAVERAQDDTALREELYDFLLPVMQYDPEPFTSVNETKQDALLLAAIWRVTEAERIHQLKDSSGISSYPVDDMDRMLIPVSEIEDSYMHLFGSGVTIYHHTIGDEGKSFTIEYNKDQGYYHIPSTSSSSSMYVPVIDTLRKKGNTITVRVGYVLFTKIGRDEKGELVDPTPDMAEKFQLYTVEKTGDNSWKLVSIANEKPSETENPSTETESPGEYVEAKLHDTSTSASSTNTTRN
jgi:hypothetical protein